MGARSKLWLYIEPLLNIQYIYIFIIEAQISIRTTQR